MADTEAIFDPSMKKKKKKKVLNLDEAPPQNEDSKGSVENVPPSDDTPKETDGTQEAPLFVGKKKKKKEKIDLKQEAEKAEAGGQAEESGVPDWTYDELIERVYNIMREKNPSAAGDSRKTFVMKPPSVARVGTKKTAFANFGEICRLLKRQPKHLLQFLFAELGTSGSVDANNCLIIKGRYQQKHIESVLRKYIKEYVTCHTCKSPDTALEKAERLFFLQCAHCGSRCSVAAIKTGFTAVTTKRARTRAQTQK